MRWISVVLAASVAFGGAACSSPSDDVIQPAEVVVEEWLASIDGSDFTTATDYTFEPSMALVIAIENHLTPEDTAALLGDGIPASVSASYWSTFRAGFDAFAGFGLTELGVESAEPIFSEGVQFAAVTVDDQASGTGLIFTRDAADRQVDLVATLAPGFVDPMLAAYRELPAGADADAVRTAYEETVVPAMWAAISSGRHGDDFNRRALSLIDAVTTEPLPTP
jgi:hypothetical protein